MCSTSSLARRGASFRRFLVVACFGTLVSEITAPCGGWAELPPPNFTVAFIGDQGLGADAEAVLELIAAQGADAVVHLGDFDYTDNPQAWENQINATLGLNFPYFAMSGNHDEDHFYGAGGYQEFIEARMNRIGIPWTGDLGVTSWHRFGGISFVMTTPGVFGAGNGVHDDFIRNSFAADDSIWRISGWHKNQHLMQAGSKPDETGWNVYEESRKAGAIIATGHEHSYSRTHLLSDIDNQVVASTSNTLVLARDNPATPADEGRTFVFVSGMGGESIRNQDRDGAWWASIYTSTQDANYGALFGVFNYLNNPRRAYFYFKDIEGRIADEFFVETSLFDSSGPTTTVTTTTTLVAPTTTLVAPGTTLPAGGIVARQVVTGSASASSTVATAQPLAGVAGDLYLASIASKMDAQVLAVHGLGLAWSEIVAQCAGRDQTGVALWVGQGVPTGSGVVTATIVGQPAHSVIVATRYGGVDLADPLGAAASANSNGSAGLCSGGIDSASYALQVATNKPESVIHVAAAMRYRSHTATSPLVEQVEVHSEGLPGTVAGIATSERLVVQPSVVTVGGTFGATVDWAAAAVALSPDPSPPVTSSTTSTTTSTTSTTTSSTSTTTSTPTTSTTNTTSTTSTTTSSTTTTTGTTTTTNTLPPPGLFVTRLAKVRRLDQAPGRQRAKLRSDYLNGAGFAFDPAADTLVFRLQHGNVVLAEATLAAGDADWNVAGGRYRWEASLGSEAYQLRVVDLRLDTSLDLFRVAVRFANLDLGGAPVPPYLTVTLSLGSAVWTGPTPPCASFFGGSTLRCR